MRKRSASLVLLALSLASCSIPVATSPPQPTVLSCLVPVITPMPETRLTQTKGGVEITIAPASYSTRVTMDESRQEVQPPFLSIKPKDATRYMEIKKVPVISVQPERLQFRVLINNQLPRVFRGAGTVVQFSVAGKSQPAGISEYKELTDVIIAPRQQQEITIYGPLVSQLSGQKFNLGLFIFDVVSKMDGAGNITEKQNFEWFFDYDPKLHTEAGPPVQRILGWM